MNVQGKKPIRHSRGTNLWAGKRFINAMTFMNGWETVYPGAGLENVDLGW